MKTNSKKIIGKAIYVLGVWCAGLMFQPSLSAQTPQGKTATAKSAQEAVADTTKTHTPRTDTKASTGKSTKENASDTAQVRTVRTDVVTPLAQNKKGKKDKKDKKEVLPLVTYKDVEARVAGDTLRLRFTVEARTGSLGRNEALHIVPIYASGEHQYPFRSVVLQDPLRHRFYLRETELLSREEYKKRTENEQVTILARSKEAKQEPIRFEGEMLLPADQIAEGGDNRLELYQFLEDCCNYNPLDTYPVAITYPAKPEPPKVVLPPTAPNLKPGDMLFYRPDAEKVKLRAEHATVRVQFKVGKHDIVSSFGQNYLELAKVTRILQPIVETPDDIEVQKLTITGYASPEGDFNANLALSQRRADSFKAYLITMYGSLSSLSQFPAVGKGEDWAGLRKSVEESPYVPMKEDVLRLIDGYSIEGGREARLMQLGGGSVYKYLLENLYPPLRRMDMEVAYKVRNFKPEEVESVYDRRPQDLSQEEIYEVAQRRNKDGVAHAEFGREYDTAARFYPEDKIANLNASSAALVRRDLAQAWQYLCHISDAPEAATNMGLYYWLSGKYGMAARYFEKALNDPRQAAKAGEYLKQLKASGVDLTGTADAKGQPVQSGNAKEGKRK